MSSTPTPTGAPWWKFGHMWLVVAGPAIVVVAGLFTFWLALRAPDPVYADAPRRAAAGRADAAAVPAVQARNHAATGGLVRQQAPSERSTGARP